MSKDVLKLALSCIKSSAEYKRGNATFVETAEDIEQALAAPVQEPVATLFGSLPVYDTTPPAAQRQWDYEALSRAWYSIGADVAGLKWDDFVAKLKEKNT